MALIYNKIVESSTEPSPNDLWLKDGKLMHYKGGWKEISGKSDTNVENLQGGNMTLVKEDVGEVDSTTYIYKSESNSGNKIFKVEYFVQNYTQDFSLLDNDGNKIGTTFINGNCVTQEQIGIDIFKIIVYYGNSSTEVYILNKPIGYICLGEYTNVMPTDLIGTEDKVTYSIKEYA